jgi:hypothetical protein
MESDILEWTRLSKTELRARYHCHCSSLLGGVGWQAMLRVCVGGGGRGGTKHVAIMAQRQPTLEPPCLVDVLVVVKLRFFVLNSTRRSDRNPMQPCLQCCVTSSTGQQSSWSECPQPCLPCCIKVPDVRESKPILRTTELP